MTRWREHAACADPLVEPDLFDVDPARFNQATKDRMFDAAEICSSCPVVDACLNDAVTTRAVEVIRAGRVFGVHHRTAPTVAQYITDKSQPRTKIPTRECGTCGETYHPVNSAQKYCTPQCKFHADWKRRSPRGRELAGRTCAAVACVTRFDATNPRHRYCSEACRDMSRRESS